MSDIRIQHFGHRARIHGEDSGPTRERLNRAMADVLDGGLESALLHAGVDTDEEICIKRLVTRTQLDLSCSDLQLTAVWSAAWVDAFRAVLQSGGANVVRYRSRVHLLIDMALRIVRGDDSRAWAWRQLGAWKATPAGSPRAAIELAQVVARHPNAVLPVCSALARENALGRWMAGLPGDSLVSLVKAALRAADSGEALLFAGRGRDPAAPTLQVHHARKLRIMRMLATSELLSELLPIARAGHQDAAAVLLALSVEPTALRAGNAGRLLEAGRELFESGGRVADTNRDPASEPDVGTVQSPRCEPPAETTRAGGRASRRTEHPRITRDVAPARRRAADPVQDSCVPPAREEPERAAPVRCAGTHSAFGGLAYLLWLVEAAGVLQAVDGENPLASRGLRWTLKQMALQLLPLGLDDPVLWAFAGLAPPGVDAPLNEDEDPVPAEAAEIAVLTNRLLTHLRDRLDEPALPRERLLDVVCRRDADIFFDPGWIELRFKAEAASTAIRRSGLDRDPGWLPWLGTVVKFAYD